MTQEDTKKTEGEEEYDEEYEQDLEYEFSGTSLFPPITDCTA